jgi:predicted metalloprotease
MVLAIVMAVVLGVIAVAIVKPEIFRSSGTTTSAPTAKSTAGSTSESRTTTTRSTRTTTARTTTSTSTTPSVQPVPTGEQALSGNPIFQAGGMAKQVCGPPGYPSDEPSGEAFYAAALPCVERAWQPLFERVRMEYDRPQVMVPAGTTATSPCGTVSTEEAAAFYCSSNETIYMPIAGLPESWTEGRPLNYLSVFAHEFGHHVQELTGTFDEGWERMREAGRETPAGLETNRRLELQVQCFAGMFVESIVDSGGPFARPDIDHTRRFEYGSGNDSPTHGTAANVEGWWVRGIRNQIADCNSWSASSAEVA